jgi:hypothetical protein
MNIEHLIPKHNLAWNKCYFEVGDNWVEPVKELIQKIIEVDDEVQFIQIKNKWGHLTIYYDSTEKHSRIIDGLIAECAAKLPTSKGNL